MSPSRLRDQGLEPTRPAKMAMALEAAPRLSRTQKQGKPKWAAKRAAVRLKGRRRQILAAMPGSVP
eukprot:1722352-Alexandrium_andersonii.AAC.1